MDMNTQILVIGGGAGGLAAAAAAAELGVQTLVLEAAKAPGGNGLFPRGMFGVDSRVQRRNLVFADPDAVFHSAMAFNHWGADALLTRTLISRSGDTVDWLEDKGVPFSRVVPHLPNQTPAVYHIVEPPLTTGRSVVEALVDSCRASGARILTGTRALSLITDQAGGVTGVRAQGQDGGAPLNITADSVIVSTGGFSGSRELIQRFFPDVDAEGVMAGPGMRHKGEGLHMAMAAGAALDSGFALEACAPRIKGHPAVAQFLASPQAIWVNKMGRRFADEGIVHDFATAASAVLRQPDSALWVIFDSAVMADTLAQGPDIIELIHSQGQERQELGPALEKAEAAGILKICGSLEELAKFIGCGYGELKGTVEDYNRGCKARRDSSLAKSPRHLRPLDSPPYYAIRAGVDTMVTHGGLKVDERMRAQSADKGPIPGLYVSGVDIGGVDTGVYNVNMSGHSFGFAVVSGRIAGEGAARTLLGAGPGQQSHSSR